MRGVSETRFCMEINSRHARVPGRPNLLLLDSTGSVSQLAERSKTFRSFSLGTLRADVPALRLHTLSRFHLGKDRRRADSPRLVVPDSSQHAHFYRCGVWGVRKPGWLTKMASVLLLAFSVPTLLVFAQGI